MIDNTVIQKYAPVIASALILIVPAVDVLAKNPTLVGVLQFVALVAATVATFKLRAPYKQVAEWVGVVVAAILPLAITGTLTWENWALVAVAVVKALATHLGVAIRKDDDVAAPLQPAVIDTIQFEDPADTSAAVAFEATPGSGDALVAGDGLGDAKGRHEA